MKTLILKYLTNEISPSELEVFRNWLKKSKNKEVFEKYIRDFYLLNRSYDAVDVAGSYQKVWQKIQEQEKPVRKLYRKKVKYALVASVALLVGFTAFFYNQNQSLNDVQPIESVVSTGTDKAILTTADGRTIALEKGKKFKNGNMVSNGEELVYSQGSTSKAPMAYNYLTIPRGGQYFLKLADGTQIWLNSDSKLKYPVLFNKGESRNVELLYGEAYFAVSPSSAHQGDKFKVLNRNQQIEVIGTEFNVKAYGDESVIYTTLVKGKIALKTGNTTNYLFPDKQAVLDLSSNTVVISSVDVYNDIAWKDGIFSFESKPLKEIMKVLSRWYDIEVSYGSASIENARFNGTLRKDQKIENVLETIKSYGVIKQYTIKNKTVELK